MSRISVAGKKLIERQMKGSSAKLDKLTIPLFKENEIIPEEERFKTLKQWKFFPGDRVLITKGEKKGTITKIEAYEQSQNQFRLENGPYREKVVPKQLWTEGSSSYVMRVQVPVSQDNLKLVVKIEDEQSGKEKDVIVHDFEFLGNHYNKDYQTYMPTRVVRDKGEVLVLPWPAPASPLERTAASGEDENSERTYFVDSAVRNSIPAGALADIRNPYSKHRRGVFEQRHLNKFFGPAMPLTEARKVYLKELDEKKKMGYSKLTDDVKEMIGARVKQYIESQKKELDI